VNIPQEPDVPIAAQSAFASIMSGLLMLLSATQLLSLTALPAK
jgi:hypothetical protein